MKIAIIGYSGSGKSTTAEFLSKKYNISIMYLDKVHHLPNWVENTRENELKQVLEFLENNESYIIDGNYPKLYYKRRMNEADKIIFMNFNRFNCLFRAIKRYFKYKGKSRKSMTQGCDEKIDLKFILWILHYGRTKERKSHYKWVIDNYGDKVIIINNQRQLNKLYNDLT